MYTEQYIKIYSSYMYVSVQTIRLINETKIWGERECHVRLSSAITGEKMKQIKKSKRHRFVCVLFGLIHTGCRWGVRIHRRIFFCCYLFFFVSLFYFFFVVVVALPEVFHIGNGYGWILNSVINHGVNGHCHRVTRQDLFGHIKKEFMQNISAAIGNQYDNNPKRSSDKIKRNSN